jgi:hypothetical protein
VRQLGTELSWFGEVCSAGDGVPISGNVFVGRVAGASVSGTWVDVPYGTNNNALDLTLSLAPNLMSGFGRVWQRVPTFENLLVSSVNVTITTGGADGGDLRGGAVAYGTIELADGRMLPKVNLNGGAGWDDNSVHTVSVPLPAGTHVRDVVAFTVEHDGAPRNFFETYDNWYVERVQVSFAMSGVSCPLQIGRSATPGWLTGERTFFRAVLD